MHRIVAYLKPIIRKKTTIFTFILIGILMSLTIVVETYYDTSYNAYYGDIKENILFNTYYVTKNNDKKIPNGELKNNTKKELEEIEHVVGAFYSLTRINGGIVENFEKGERMTGRIQILAGNNTSIPEIVYGNSFPEDDNAYYIICPANFIPVGQLTNKYSRFDMIDLTKYINKDFQFRYMSYSSGKEELADSLKLVGLYKNSTSLSDESICYVKESYLDTMYSRQIGQPIDDSFVEEAISFYVQVDKYANKEEVKKTLEQKGFNVKETTEIAFEDFDKIASNVSSIYKILNITIFILIFLSLIKQFFDNTKYYNLLTFLGYKKSKICLINVISNLVLIIISSMITFIIAIFLKEILEIVVYFKPFIFNKFEIVMNYNSLTYVIFLGVVTSLVVSIFGCIKVNVDEVKIK